MNAVEQFGHTSQAFKHYLPRSWYPFALPGLDDGSRTQGQQGQPWSDFEALCTTIRTRQYIVVEPVFLIPHIFRPRLIHGTGDPKEMVNVLDNHVLVERVVGRQFHGYLSHVLTEKCYPGSAVCLLEVAAGRQRRVAVEDANIIQTQGIRPLTSSP